MDHDELSVELHSSELYDIQQQKEHLLHLKSNKEIFKDYSSDHNKQLIVIDDLNDSELDDFGLKRKER